MRLSIIFCTKNKQLDCYKKYKTAKQASNCPTPCQELEKKIFYFQNDKKLAILCFSKIKIPYIVYKKSTTEQKLANNQAKSTFSE